MHPSRVVRRWSLVVLVITAVVFSACTPGQAGGAGASAGCFTVTLPTGWTSQPTDKCGLELKGPQGASGMISVDTEPVDAAQVKALISQKFSEADVTERTVGSDQVLVGTGAVPGALYIVVQARSASSGRSGYYAQVLTPQQSQVAEIKSMLATVRTTAG